MLAALRRIRLALWMAGIRARLRRHGARLELELGRNLRFAGRPRLDIDPYGTSGGVLRLAIGDHVRVGRDLVVELRDFCELKSSGELALGTRAICGRNVTLHCVERVVLGPRVGLAERVTITDSDHGHDGSDRWFMDQPVVVEPVVLEDNAFVATNSVVLRGSTLRRNAVVAAGAVVAGLDVPEGHLAGGVPARTLKDLRDGSVLGS